MDVSHIFSEHGPKFFPYIVFGCALLENDVTFMMAGIYAASIHPHLSLTAAILCGVAGALVHDSLWYWLGRSNSGWLRRTSAWKKLGLQIENWAQRFGQKELFLCRFIPGTRNASCLFWGISRMKAAVFYTIEVAALLLWGSALVFLGFKFGQQAQALWGKVKRHHLGQWMLLALVITLVVYFSIRAITKHEIVKHGRPPEDPRAD